MPWSKLDDGFHEHPKTVAMSDKAFRLYVCAITYSSRHRLLGKLTKAHAAVLYRLTGASDSEAQELVDLIAWETDGSGYIIHGFTDYNANWDEISEKRSAAGRLGGIASGTTRSKRSKLEASASTNGKQNEASTKQTSSKGTPIPEPIPNPISESKDSAPPNPPRGERASADEPPQPVAGDDHSATDSGRSKSKRASFMPPQLAEVTEFFTELGRCDQAEPFHDYYTANGWMIGRTPMKDWKAAARGWLRNEYFRKPINGRGSNPSLDDLAVKNLETIKRLGI